MSFSYPSIMLFRIFYRIRFEIYNICWLHILTVGRDSSVGIATGYGLDGPGIERRWGARFSAPVQTGPGAHPASCTTGTGSFPGAKSGLGVTLTPHPLLVPWSWKSRAIPLLPLWAVRPVQSLSACTRGHFTFFYFLHILIYLQRTYYITACDWTNVRNSGALFLAPLHPGWITQ